VELLTAWRHREIHTQRHRGTENLNEFKAPRNLAPRVVSDLVRLLIPDP